jgi:hypothetical protein
LNARYGLNQLGGAAAGLAPGIDEEDALLKDLEGECWVYLGCLSFQLTVICVISEPQGTKRRKMRSIMYM